MNKVIVLPSGHKISVIQFGDKYFTSGESAFYFTYETEVSLNNTDETNSEEEEVWKMFESEADRRGMEMAIISPTNIVRDGIVANNLHYSFLYRKKNGVWILQNKLTESSHK